MSKLARRPVVALLGGSALYALVLWGMQTFLPALMLVRALASPEGVTLPVGVETLSMAGGWRTDRWFAHTAGPRRTCAVVVHGLTPDGKDDPRLRDFARALAWTGPDVYVPHVPALAEFRLDPGVVPRLRRLFREVEGRCPAWALVGISVGAGLALRSLEAESGWPRLRAVATVGTYADACRLMAVGLVGGDSTDIRSALRQALEAWGRAHGWSEAVVRHQVERLMACRSVSEVDAWCRQAPSDLQAFLGEISPIAHVPDSWRVPTWVLHSPADPIIPIEESHRLVKAFRSPAVRFVAVPVLTHVETGEGTRRMGWEWKSLLEVAWGFYRALGRGS